MSITQITVIVSLSATTVGAGTFWALQEARRVNLAREEAAMAQMARQGDYALQSLPRPAERFFWNLPDKNK